MMTANEIRDSYLKFFESKGHVIVPSAPIVVKDDPTLMFTNAGMNQWKYIILSTKEPEPRRRTDSQKCLRVGRKHYDLEEVGRD
jgi:alanyl-tRNA synthetase